MIIMMIIIIIILSIIHFTISSPEIYNETITILVSSSLSNLAQKKQKL